MNSSPHHRNQFQESCLVYAIFSQRPAFEVGYEKILWGGRKSNLLDNRLIVKLAHASISDCVNTSFKLVVMLKKQSDIGRP